MSDPDEGFLQRWSRRKREAAVAPPAAADAAAPAVDPEPVGIDLESLPSLDSITAETDIRVFLAPGVPAELTRAALRRAWAADPQIRDFIGLAENQWDFTAADGMHGFGQLGVEEARRLVAEIIGDGTPPAATADPAGVTEKTALSPLPGAAPPGLGEAQEPAKLNPQACPPDAIANDSQVMMPIATVKSESQLSSGPEESKGFELRRSHGRALPE